MIQAQGKNSKIRQKPGTYALLPRSRSERENVVLFKIAKSEEAYQ